MIRKLSFPLIRTIRRPFAESKLLLQQIGEGIKEAKIVEIFIKEGQQAKHFENLLKIESDKGTADISAPYDLTVKKYLHKLGDICEIGAPLAIVDDGNAKQASHKEEKAAKAQESSKSDAPKKKGDENIRTTLPEDEKILAMPAVRIFAKEKGVDLKKVKSSSADGRIRKEDVLKLLSSQDQSSQQPSKGSRTTEKSDQEAFQVHQMTGYEKGMQKTMTSAANIPLFNLHERYDISKLFQLREEINKPLQKDEKISLFAFLIKSFSLALLSNPKINSRYSPEKDPFSFEIHSSHNITIAIDTPSGLAIPNIKNVEKLSISEIAAEVKRLKTLALSKNLTSKENDGGTVSLSNIGSMTGTYASPLPPPKQILICAIGAADMQPVWNEKTQNFEPKRILRVSFAADHRVLDGGSVARFSLDWKSLLENPGNILTKLK